MGKNVSGSIKKCLLDGISFKVMADANISEVHSEYENENVATSGDSFIKKTKRSQNREGLVLACNAEESETLKELSERTDPFPMSYTTADGKTWRSSGGIEFENRETEENRATVQLLPESKFDLF